MRCAIPCAASGSPGQITLAPYETIPAMVRGVAVSWRHPVSGNINTGVLPGVPVRLRIASHPWFDVWGPDGQTKLGALDFHEGGFFSAEWTPDLNGGFGGWVLASPPDTGTQARWNHGQCRFVSAGSNTVALHGYNGYGLWVKCPASRHWLKRNVGGGITQRIDNGTAWIDGVPGQSLAPDTLYYGYTAIYGDGLRLDFSETAHGTDPNLGIEVKGGIGGDYYTYVGILYTLGGVVGPFTGMNGLSLVSSWYNRQALPTQIRVTAAGVTQTSAGSLSADKLRIATHADNVPAVHVTGYGVGRGFIQTRADMVAGPVLGAGPFQRNAKTGGNGDPFAVHSMWSQPVPEGYIEVYPEGWVDSGSTDFDLTISAQLWL